MPKSEWIKPELSELQVERTLSGSPLFPQEGQFIPDDGGEAIPIGPGS